MEDNPLQSRTAKAWQELGEYFKDIDAIDNPKDTSLEDFSFQNQHAI